MEEGPVKPKNVVSNTVNVAAIINKLIDKNIATDGSAYIFTEEIGYKVTLKLLDEYQKQGWDIRFFNEADFIDMPKLVPIDPWRVILKEEMCSKSYFVFTKRREQEMETETTTPTTLMNKMFF